MELLAFGDPHIKPAGAGINYDALDIPAEVDVVVTIGDVIHRTGAEDLMAGRSFFEHLSKAEVPVVSIPGNHDPLANYEGLIGGLDTVELAHERVLTGADFGSSAGNRAFAEFSFIGWGCETFDCEPEIQVTSFSALDPREEPNRRYAADKAATKLEDALYEYITGEQDRDALIERLRIQRDEQAVFHEQLGLVEERFHKLDTLFNSTSDPVVFLSHVPPYNTPLDRHHSIGEREANLDGLHVGSLSTKLVLRKHNPSVALSGHSHNDAYQPGIGGHKGQPHCLSLDFQGIAQITVDANDGTFGYEFL